VGRLRLITVELYDIKRERPVPTCALLMQERIFGKQLMCKICRARKQEQHTLQKAKLSSVVNKRVVEFACGGVHRLTDV
jgi:hypothetical protein